MTMTRRLLLISAAVIAFSPASAAENPLIHVVQDANCECCTQWIKVLERDGFTVTSENSLGMLLIRHKLDNGVPREMISCHTGTVDGYVIEGHVPPADISRLLEERPDATGLAVPGMPYGSPGMGPESKREAYDVFLIRRDGSTEVYTSYSAA